MTPDLISIFSWVLHASIAFSASFIGSLCYDIIIPIERLEKSPLSPRMRIVKALCSSFFISLILAALEDKFQLNFALYVAIAGCIGGLNDIIFKKLFIDGLFWRFIKHFSKNVKNIIGKSVYDALAEEEEENKKDGE